MLCVVNEFVVLNGTRANAWDLVFNPYEELEEQLEEEGEREEQLEEEGEREEQLEEEEGELEPDDKKLKDHQKLEEEEEECCNNVVGENVEC